MSTTIRTAPGTWRAEPVDCADSPVRIGGWWRDLLVVVLFLAIAAWLYAGLIVDPAGKYLVDSAQDQAQWEWYFSAVAHIVATGGNPFFSDLLNYPLGVNLMANTSTLGLAIPLAPITWLFGAPVTWVVVMAGGLTATGFCWYWLLHRRLGIGRAAAALGGGFCAFAPPMISHGNAHPNFVVLFLLPLIVQELMFLYEGRNTVRHGVILGILVTYQVFIGEEALLIAATGLLVLACWYRNILLLKGLGFAVLTAVLLLAYPLYWQFFGPQSYRSLLHGNAANDLGALGAFAARSLAGHRQSAVTLSMGPTEQNLFFGWPLLILLVVIVGWKWKSRLVRALTVLILVGILISLGNPIIVHGTRTDIPGPWALIGKLPLFDSVLVSRFSMVCVPAIGVLLAIATRHWLRARYLPRVCGLAAVCAVLAPIVPTPFVLSARPATPAFFTDGQWRDYVRPGHSLISAPVPSPLDVTAERWQAAAGFGFPLPGGYFLGPSSDRGGIYGGSQLATGALLDKVADGAATPAITAKTRAQAAVDLRYWRADAVVVAPRPHADALRSTLTELLGPGTETGGVTVWSTQNYLK